jgi:hypothetical protein
MATSISDRLLDFSVPSDDSRLTDLMPFVGSANETALQGRNHRSPAKRIPIDDVRLPEEHRAQENPSVRTALWLPAIVASCKAKRF